MPESPRVDFSVTNQNVASITPTLGIGFMVARTTKGNFFDPSELINNPNQFKEKFGTEIVPDGSKSNIERALEMGAKVRVCRVGHLNNGKVDAVKGTVVSGKLSGNAYVADTGATLDVILTGYSENPITFKLKFQTKEYGGDISSTNGKFMEVFSLSGNDVITTLYNTNVKVNLTSAFLVYQNTFMRFVNGNATTPLFVDTNLLNNFFKADGYLETSLVEALEGSTKSTEITSLADMLSVLDKAQRVNNTTLAIKSSNATAVTLSASSPLYYLGTVGNAGTTPNTEDWKAGLDTSRDYMDFYDLICSHLHQHLDNSSTLAVHQYAGSVAESMKETMYDVEIPKVNTTEETIIAYRDSVGLSSKQVAYFAGGLKLYNNDGELEETDVLGTVLGLSANSATNYGPWYSFAGQNRGIVGDAHGPVAVNYGSPANYEKLNNIAKKSINIFVIKEVASGGKATLLWHNFTSTLLSDSERFLNVERLIFYCKKSLRPYLEKYLEEPNNFATWSNLYLEIEPIFTNLQNKNAVHSWEWIGDQYATSFNDCVVNNEKDVRQGKYKAIFKFKEVVSMQIIEIQFLLDASLGTIESNTTIQ